MALRRLAMCIALNRVPAAKRSHSLSLSFSPVSTDIFPSFKVAQISVADT